MINWGKVPLASVLPFIFDSFDGGTGASITLTGLAVGDIFIYKGGSMTQRASTAGFVLLETDGIDLDTNTGIHGFSIDTGDNTDAGFFVAGSFYTVVVASVTIDAQTVNFVAGTFWLGPTLTVAGVDEVDITHWRGEQVVTTTVAGYPKVDTAYIGSTAQTGADLSVVINDVDNFVDTEIANIQSRLPAALTANGNMKCSLMEIISTALTETAGQIAAAFKQFFDVGTPTGTMKAITLVSTCTTNTDMRGTDSAALASVCTEARLSELDAATGGKMANQVDVIEVDTTANLDAAISTRATPAQVNTEVLDVLNTDTFAEPGQEAPGATVSLVKKIGYIYKAFRNKFTQDATTAKLYADDGTTVDQKSTVSDDATTFTRGEMGTGP